MSIAVGTSNMHQYIGYAAADKALDSRELLVYPAEFLPFLSGELSAKEIDNDVVTNGRNTYQSTVKTTTILKCLYRDETSNRAFPPDIRKGEEVIIYNYGDDNTWYWKSSARNDNARRTETYRISVSGTLDNTAESSDDNTYFLELDTRRSHRIRLSTSNANGETFRYQLNLDADAGSVFLGDDAGNQIYINSAQPRLCMKNASNSLIDLNDKNIVIMAERDISIVSTNGNLSFSAQSGSSTHYARNTITQRTDADMNITTATNYSVSARGTGNIVSRGNMTVRSEANTTVQSGGDLMLNAGGSLSISFNGTGTCIGHGASLTMTLGRLSIIQG